MISRFIRPIAPALTLVAAVATSMLLGCGGSTPEQAAISEASATLHGLGVSGSEPLPAVGDRKARYESVVKTIKPIADAGKGADSAAASALLAKAQGGLAEIASTNAAEVERAALGQITGIRATYEQWLSQQSIANALQAYDPTSELAKLDEEIRQREAEAARAEEAKQQQVKLVEQTRAKAAQARAQAEQYRNQEASIRAGVASASETQRAAAFEQAIAVRRQGDEYEKQAGELDATAASQAPEVDTLQNTIEKLNRQVQLLRDAKKALVTRAEANRSQAAEAAKEADAASARVADLLKELDATRAAVVAPTEEAVRLYGAAVSAARKAGAPGGASGRGVGPVMAGNLQQSLGDVLAAKARGLGAYSTLLQALKQGAHPAVSSEAAAAAAQAHSEAVTAAAEAYKGAITLFESAGGTAEAKEKIDRLTKQIQRLVTEEAAPAGEQPVEQPADGAMGAAGDKPADVAADFDKAAVEAEIRQFVQEISTELAGDNFAVMLDRTRFDTDEQKELAQSMIHGVESVVKLNKASEAKFGKGLAALASESKLPQIQAMAPMVQQFAGPEMLDKMRQTDVDPATVRIEATSATEGSVYDTSDKPDKPSTVRKIDGKWWMIAKSDEMAAAAMVAPMLAKLGTLCEDLRGKLESGAFATADDLLTAFAQGMMTMMGPGGGGGGGGAGPGGG